MPATRRTTASRKVARIGLVVNILLSAPLVRVATSADTRSARGDSPRANDNPALMVPFTRDVVIGPFAAALLISTVQRAAERATPRRARRFWSSLRARARLLETVPSFQPSCRAASVRLFPSRQPSTKAAP